MIAGHENLFSHSLYECDLFITRKKKLLYTKDEAIKSTITEKFVSKRNNLFCSKCFDF